MGKAFLPPKINPLLIAMVRAMLPFILQGPLGGLNVKIDDPSMARLRRLKGERMLLLPNHPTGEEPYVLFEISKQLDEVFNYVAAREIFNWEMGLRGWLLQRAGVYSVIRGAVDRESFAMTRKILSEGKNRLVIFVEGEISHENDTLIPFEPGVLQLGFWAQDKLAKETKSEDFPPIYVTPVAIKYFYHKGTDAVICKALQRLEEATGITSPAPDTYDRIRRLGVRLLEVQERTLDLPTRENASLDERMTAVRNRILKKMELFLELTPPENATLFDRVRDIRNRMDRMVFLYEDDRQLSEYEHRTLAHLRDTFKEFYEDLERVIYFATFHDGRLRDNPTPERTIEVLRRLEKEVFGKPLIYYHRTAVVQVGEPVSLKKLLPAYERDKKQMVRTLAADMEREMDGMLKAMRRPDN